MKKIVNSLIVGGFSLLVLTMPVSASSNFEANIIGNSTFEDEITLNIEVTNLQNFNGSCTGLCGLVSTLNYDNTKIELVETKALEGFELASGKNIVLYKSTGVNSGTKILSLKFKNKSLEHNESVNISLKNIVASDGDNDIPTKDISKIIKFIDQEVIKEEEIKKEENKKEEETIKVLSSNNNLKSILLSMGNIDFNKDILSYDVEVENNIESITINAYPDSTKASVEGSGEHKLKIGNNSIKLVVKAENGEEKTYTLNVLRKSATIDKENNDSINVDDNKEENIFDNKYLVPLSIGVAFIVLMFIAIGIYKSRS